MDGEFKKYITELGLNKPASLNTIEEVEKSLGIKFPSDYVDFMLFTNGCEGSIGESYIVMWPIEEIVQNNEDFEVEEYVPGLILFGSNGSGEAFGFDMRTEKPSYIMVPFLLEAEAVISQGSTINAFFERLYTDTLFER